MGPYVSVDGCGIAVRVSIRGTMSGPLDPPGFAATGSKVEFQTAEFSQIRDGLLARRTVILDMLDLARQIGAVPNPGGVADRLGVWSQRIGAFWSRNRRARRRPQRHVFSARSIASKDAYLWPFTMGDSEVLAFRQRLIV